MSAQARSAETRPDISEDGEDGSTVAGPEELSTDRVFHLLQNERRRLILRHLRGTDGVVDMRDVVEGVAAEEYGTDPRQLSSTERQRVYIALYQSHLPKLADAGVIEYEQSRGRVERTVIADQLDQHLDDDQQAVAVDRRPDGTGPSWDRYYQVAAVGGLGLFLVGTAGLLSAVPATGFAVAGVIVAAFLGLAVAQRLERS